MFGISFSELLVIFLIILVVFGPERLPQIANTLGKALGEFNRKTNDFTNNIKDEFNDVIDDKTRVAHENTKKLTSQKVQSDDKSSQD